LLFHNVFVVGRTIEIDPSSRNIVEGGIGVDSIHVYFDNPEWLDFPITAVFSNGSRRASQAVSITAPSEQSDWAAEGQCEIPWEVTQDDGLLEIAFRGSGEDGRKIVTAKGAHFFVVPSMASKADVAPASDIPTVDEWNAAYANAVAAANQATLVATEFESRIDEAVESAKAELGDIADNAFGPATDSELGLVKIGSGLRVSDDGRIDVTSVSGLSDSQKSQIANLAALAYYCFDTSFDEDGNLNEDAALKPSSLPKATVLSPGAVMPDGTSIFVDGNGIIRSASGFSSYEATVSDGESPSVSVAPSRDGSTLVFSFCGLKGDKGDRGPAGYELTQDDISAISNAIIEQYQLGDTTRY